MVETPTTAACRTERRGYGRQLGINSAAVTLGGNLESNLDRGARPWARRGARCDRPDDRSDAEGDRGRIGAFESIALRTLRRDRASRGGRLRHRGRHLVSTADRFFQISRIDSHLLEAVEGGDGGDSLLGGNLNGGLGGDGGAEEGGGHGGHFM